jgi:hypothetical protein
MKRTLLGLIAVAAICLTGRPLLAHHALQAEFDTSKRGEFTGVLTKFSMVNPHVRWYFDVKKPDGTTAQWELTGAGPQPLRSNGMVRLFKAGDTIKCTYAPARDGSNTGRVVTFTFSDGRVITLYHEDPNNPNDL